MKRPYKTWVEISRTALRHNARALQSVAGKDVALLAAIKANAYGHGLPEVVRALAASPVDWYGVDALREADAVRAIDKKRPILIMGYTPLADIPRAVKAGHRLVAYDLQTLRTANRAASTKRPARVHLKLETGTSRQGILEQDLVAFARELKKLKRVVVEGVYTHYANIEDTTDPSYAESQRTAFERMRARLKALGIDPPLPHTASSAGAILYPAARFALVRAGIALYGLWPSKETRASSADRGLALELRPALAWKTVVAQVKTLPAGTPVSYGLTERVTRRSKIAVLPVGYWDGFDRKLSSVGHVLIKGKRAKVLGRVCMNMVVVDVTDIPGVKQEDEVVLLGRQGKDHVFAEDLAAKVGTINYEIVTRINPTIPRVLV